MIRKWLRNWLGVADQDQKSSAIMLATEHSFGKADIQLEELYDARILHAKSITACMDQMEVIRAALYNHLQDHTSKIDLGEVVYEAKGEN
jgi:hypothetical protein